MGNVFVYDANEKDFTSLGLCGELIPTSCSFHEIANGDSEVTLEHPIDRWRKYTCLVEGRVLKVSVPVRTTPEIANGQYVTVVEEYRVLNTATKDNRYIYNRREPDTSKDKKKQLVPVGGRVIVVSKYEPDSDRWKVKYSYSVRENKKTIAKSITGFMAHDANTLALVEERTISAESTGIEAVAPSWNVNEQYFRIVSVQKSDSGITVRAKHISYDLMNNITSFFFNGERTLQQAADGILDGCFDPHDFTIQTNITGTKSGFHFANKDPITALLDPETGIVPRWNGQLIRDNFNLVILDRAGANRGMLFAHGHNVKGVDMTTDISSVATAMRPIGENEDGNPLYLDHSYICDSSWNATQLPDTNGIVYGTYHHYSSGVLTCDLPTARIWAFDGDDCKVNKDSGVTESIVKNRMLSQAIASLRDGSQDPEISLQVDMQQLGFTQEWEMYRTLERSYLFDTVRVLHKRLGIDVDAIISEVEWDCLLDRPTRYTIGTVVNQMPSVASWQIQNLNGEKIESRSVDAGRLSDKVNADIINAGENAETAQYTAESASSVAAIAKEQIDNLNEMVYEFGGGIRIGKEGSQYNTFTDDSGFHIQQQGSTIGSFAKRMLATETVRIGKIDTIDERLVIRLSYDGGIEIIGEED